MKKYLITFIFLSATVFNHVKAMDEVQIIQGKRKEVSDSIEAAKGLVEFERQSLIQYKGMLSKATKPWQVESLHRSIEGNEKQIAKLEDNLKRFNEELKSVNVRLEHAVQRATAVMARKVVADEIKNKEQILITQEGVHKEYQKLVDLAKGQLKEQLKKNMEISKKLIESVATDIKQLTDGLSVLDVKSVQAA